MPIKNVDAATLKRWMDSGEAVVVDVREPAEHDAEKIQGATLVPLGTVTKSSVPCCEGKKLVIHCRSGKRGASACEKLLAEDPNLEVYNLEGGISAWGAAGHSIVASGKFFLPLDRQVQLAIGLMLIASSVLGAIFSPVWFLLTGLIGVGLTFAGFTGFCGLAMMMAKMPWNKNVARTTSCNVK
ncbi:MAG: rhodanese-like domain-containing protein [Alphaproteobacteria bacterium]|nr:rhodanese-like domain-containing protein [Alphaproteobacteria bacterium]